MKEIDPKISDAIRDACGKLGQSGKVSARIMAWLEAVAGEGLSAEEKAQRLGLIRDEIDPTKAESS